MPNYVYKCDAGHYHEYWCHIDNRDNARICPAPGCTKPCRAIISPVPTTFKHADKSAHKSR